jgi:hypothetical protein
MRAGGILMCATVFILMVPVSTCWIPFAEETAIVVEVLNARDVSEDGVRFYLDSVGTLTTGDQLNPGQIFKNLSSPGSHTLQMEVGIPVDPQEGAGWVPLASRISGELLPLFFSRRPFLGGCP